MKNQFCLERFKSLPLMCILRGITETMVTPLVEVCIRAGIGAIEVTMNTPGAPELIHRAITVAGGNLAVGAGTVLSLQDLQIARKAGAAFAVSPVLIPEVAKLCCGEEIPFFPGAFTPQEIFNAWQAGATMIKLFPAKFSGPEYFKEIKGPFNEIPLLACGGVSAVNLEHYLSCGAEAFAFGSSVFKPEWLQHGDWLAMETMLRELIKAYQNANLSRHHQARVTASAGCTEITSAGL